MREDLTVYFTFEGVRYALPTDRQLTDVIKLPDGQFLKVGMWLESRPLQVADLILDYCS